jgi:hypothetical protein
MSHVDAMQKIEDLIKALDLGSYNAAPGTLTQGGALQVEDVSPVMHVVTFGDKDIKLQKELKVGKVKGQLVQFNRTLSYGVFGGAAQLEGQVGQEETSDIVRAVVPMSYYSHIRRVTIAANMAETQDGVKAEDREAQAGAKWLAGNIEFDLFRGKDDFSNAGVFDGSPAAIPNSLPNMVGLGVQVRQSDSQSSTQDLMFEAYGSALSNIIAGGGVLSQSVLEDAWIRGVMNFGTADRLMVDPLVLSAYSKASYSTKERFNLGGSAQEPVTGVDISRQAVSGGVVKLEPSRFLSGQTKPKRARASSPALPTISVSSAAGSGTAFLLNQVYQIYVTAENEQGESLPSAVTAHTVAANGRSMVTTITAGAGTARYFNVYRSAAGGTAASAKLIGRVKAAVSGTTAFTDLGNRSPGAITGFLVQMDTMEIKELSPYSRLKLAVSDLTQPEAHFRFLCLAVYEPRKSVLVDNLIGAL